MCDSPMFCFRLQYKKGLLLFLLLAAKLSLPETLLFFRYIVFLSANNEISKGKKTIFLLGVFLDGNLKGNRGHLDKKNGTLNNRTKKLCSFQISFVNSI